MEDKKLDGNVIQFPGRKKTAGEVTPPVPPSSPKPSGPNGPRKGSPTTMGAAVIAILLFTGAANRYAFQSSQNSNLASQKETGRAIASVQPMNYTRDAAWEKSLAEKLAAPQAREIASLNLGRSASKEESLRWGVLAEKYTIVFEPASHTINSIELQGVESDPAYVLDRSKFLGQYGSLFNANYHGSTLREVKAAGDNVVEAYTILDQNDQPQAEARFELDRHKRLLSLKVEPIEN